MIKLDIRKNLYISRCAILCAIAFVLSALESCVPMPILVLPGCRLGLSNIAIIVSVFVVGAGGAFSVAILKSLFVFVTRGVTAGIMSLSGGLLSLVVMLIMLYTLKFGYIGICVVSAVAHNMAQLGVCAVLMWDMHVFSFSWLYLLLSIATGLLTGTASGLIIKPLCRALRYE